jgi:hypothetical protein
MIEDDEDLFPPIPPEPADVCPKCGGELHHGYGLAGGGIGTYLSCLEDGCDYFDKTEDSSASENTP